VEAHDKVAIHQHHHRPLVFHALHEIFFH
jgi:hypothetical protein